MKLHTRYALITVLAVCSMIAAACSDEAASPQGSAPAALTQAPTATLQVSPVVKPSPSLSIEPTISPSPSPTASPVPSPTLIAPNTPKATVKPEPAKGDASRTSLSWYYMKKKAGQVPGFPNDLKQLKSNQKVACVGTGKKVYLTFDTGGPLGESDKLLSILKDNEVKAAFFLVGYNVKQFKEFTKKVSDEGHLIGNHTMTHTDMTKLSDDEVKKELNDFSNLIKEVTGKPVASLFRFPYGKYSMHLLDMVSEMGYTSVFWSTAMRDWEPRAGGAEDSYKDIMNGLHEGNVILMHQGSKENIEALDRIIKDVKKAGYEFGTLDELMQ